MKSYLAILALASLLVSACASAPGQTDVQASSNETAESKQESAAAATGALSANDASSNELAATLLEMEKQSIYFDFDDYTIKPAYRDIILQHAEFMKTHENVTVTLEGNADERGSGEYNLSLGDRRASSVRKALVLLGIPAEQIRAVSFGEERPRLSCHEERCWKENRRVDFKGKPD